MNEGQKDKLAGIGVNAEAEEFIRALEGVDFPAPKDEIVRKSRDKGGIDWEVPAALEQIADRTYESQDDLLTELHRIYETGFVPIRGGGPAAEL